MTSADGLTPTEDREAAHLAARAAGGVFIPGIHVAKMREYLDRIDDGDGDTDFALALAGYLRAALDRAERDAP